MRIGVVERGKHNTRLGGEWVINIASVLSTFGLSCHAVIHVMMALVPTCIEQAKRSIDLLLLLLLFIIIYIRQSQQTEVVLLGALNDDEDARGKLAENTRSE